MSVVDRNLVDNSRTSSRDKVPKHLDSDDTPVASPCEQYEAVLTLPPTVTGKLQGMLQVDAGLLSWNNFGDGAASYAPSDLRLRILWWRDTTCCDSLPLASSDTVGCSANGSRLLFSVLSNSQVLRRYLTDMGCLTLLVEAADFTLGRIAIQIGALSTSHVVSETCNVLGAGGKLLGTLPLSFSFHMKQPTTLAPAYNTPSGRGRRLTALRRLAAERHARSRASIAIQSPFDTKLPSTTLPHRPPSVKLSNKTQSSDTDVTARGATPVSSQQHQQLVNSSQSERAGLDENCAAAEEDQQRSDKDMLISVPSSEHLAALGTTQRESMEDKLLQGGNKPLHDSNEDTPSAIVDEVKISCQEAGMQQQQQQQQHCAEEASQHVAAGAEPQAPDVAVTLQELLDRVCQMQVALSSDRYQHQHGTTAHVNEQLMEGSALDRLLRPKTPPVAISPPRGTRVPGNGPCRRWSDSHVALRDLQHDDMVESPSWSDHKTSAMAHVASRNAAAAAEAEAFTEDVMLREVVAALTRPGSPAMVLPGSAALLHTPPYVGTADAATSTAKDDILRFGSSVSTRTATATQLAPKQGLSNLPAVTTSDPCQACSPFQTAPETQPLSPQPAVKLLVSLHSIMLSVGQPSDSTPSSTGSGPLAQRCDCGTVWCCVRARGPDSMAHVTCTAVSDTDVHRPVRQLHDSRGSVQQPGSATIFKGSTCSLDLPACEAPSTSDTVVVEVWRTPSLSCPSCTSGSKKSDRAISQTDRSGVKLREQGERNGILLGLAVVPFQGGVEQHGESLQDGTFPVRDMLRAHTVGSIHVSFSTAPHISTAPQNKGNSSPNSIRHGNRELLNVRSRAGSLHDGTYGCSSKSAGYVDNLPTDKVATSNQQPAQSNNSTPAGELHGNSIPLGDGHALQQDQQHQQQQQQEQEKGLIAMTGQGEATSPCSVHAQEKYGSSVADIVVHGASGLQPGLRATCRLNRHAEIAGPKSSVQSDTATVANDGSVCWQWHVQLSPSRMAGGRDTETHRLEVALGSSQSQSWVGNASMPAGVTPGKTLQLDLHDRDGSMVGQLSVSVGADQKAETHPTAATQTPIGVTTRRGATTDRTTACTARQLSDAIVTLSDDEDYSFPVPLDSDSSMGSIGQLPIRQPRQRRIMTGSSRGVPLSPVVGGVSDDWLFGMGGSGGNDDSLASQLAGCDDVDELLRLLRLQPQQTDIPCHSSQDDILHQSLQDDALRQPPSSSGSDASGNAEQAARCSSWPWSDLDDEQIASRAGKPSTGKADRSSAEASRHGSGKRAAAKTRQEAHMFAAVSATDSQSDSSDDFVVQRCSYTANSHSLPADQGPNKTSRQQRRRTSFVNALPSCPKEYLADMRHRVRPRSQNGDQPSKPKVAYECPSRQDVTAHKTSTHGSEGCYIISSDSGSDDVEDMPGSRESHPNTRTVDRSGVRFANALPPLPRPTPKRPLRQQQAREHQQRQQRPHDTQSSDVSGNDRHGGSASGDRSSPARAGVVADSPDSDRLSPNERKQAAGRPLDLDRLDGPVEPSAQSQWQRSRASAHDYDFSSCPAVEEFRKAVREIERQHGWG